jgi:hypothetical protein
MKKEMVITSDKLMWLSDPGLAGGCAAAQDAIAVKTTVAAERRPGAAMRAPRRLGFWRSWAWSCWVTWVSGVSRILKTRLLRDVY